VLKEVLSDQRIQRFVLKEGLSESSALLDVKQVNELRFDPAMYKTGDADGLLFKVVDSDFATDALEHALEHVSFFCFCCCARGNEVSTS
jgi:hypothetical protein